MKEKERYTLEELFNHLAITVTELSSLAGMSEVTIRRIRHGYPARRSTANKLLLAFSKAYDRDLSVDNVSGLVLDDRQRPEKPIEAPISAPVVPTTRGVAEKAEKRTYKPRDTGLPDGAILAKHFAENHNVKWGTFYDHLTKGLGPGLIGESTATIQQRDQVAHEAPPNPKRKSETIRYLTQEQQKAALEFWQRHKVLFTQCESTPCWCHTFLEEIE